MVNRIAIRRIAASIAMALAPLFAWGQGGPLAVDVVVLKSGESIRGSVVDSSGAENTSVAVSREWLQNKHPALYRRHTLHEVDEQTAAVNNALARARQWKAEVIAQPRLAAFLDQQIERMEQLDPAKQRSEFLLLQLAKPHISRVNAATPDRRQVAAWAWHERLGQVETRDAGALKAALVERGVRLDAQAPDLSDRLPAIAQSDREWQARQAIVESVFVRAIEYQGTDGAWFRTDGGKAPNWDVILPKLMSGRASSLLAELGLGTGGSKRENAAAIDRAALQRAAQEAMDEGVRGFRVTTMAMDEAQLRATVETRFVVMFGPKSPQVIWKHAATSDGGAAHPELERRIRDDPQIAGVLKAVGSLDGLGGAADEAITRAVRLGAAVMTAQKSVDQAFFAFRDRYVNRLEGPPLSVPPGE